MSLSESGSGMADSLDELTKQTRRTSFIVQASELNGSDGQNFGGGPPNIKPPSNDDPLDRNQVAELVGLEIQHFTAHVRNTAALAAGTEPGSADVEFDITQLGPTDANKRNLSNQVQGGIFENVDELTNNNFFKFRLFVSQPFKDGAVGTGGAPGTSFLGPFFINYRKEFGRGPFYRHSDEIGTGFNFTVFNIDTQPVEASVAYTLYWDVFEREEEDLTNIFG